MLIYREGVKKISAVRVEKSQEGRVELRYSLRERENRGRNGTTNERTSQEVATALLK